MASELGAFLRTWRDRLAPADAGLPAGTLRRAPGLRREEVAGLAGLSVDYLARLEQGRATSPSPSVLGPLARALRLTDDERDHLFRLSGHVAPGSGHVRRHMTPGVQRILDRLSDVPVTVLDASWTVVAQNALAVALVGDLTSAPERERNLVWRAVNAAPTRIEHDAADARTFLAEAAADLHAAVGRYPDDDDLRALVGVLREASPEFAAAWARRPVGPRATDRKTLVHPQVGRITVDCDVLHVRESDLRLVVYTAPAGSPDARALALVGTLGLQTV